VTIMSDIKAMSNLLGKYPPRMHMLKKWVSRTLF